MNGLIETDKVSARYRQLSVDTAHQLLRITNFEGTEQEKDFTEEPNCGGFGRVRHFNRATSPGWPSNPLPIDPALKVLGLPASDILRAQAFQTASCNWRCWYCFVPFELLSASPKYSQWLSPSTLVRMYLEQSSPPKVIDLTGGQPDLVPEWVLWMMKELESRNLHRTIYLWSDDNLSTDYFWRYLSNSDRDYIAAYANYGKVCCFKGFDEESFSFNTTAQPELFRRQFELFGRLLGLGIDLYAYVTLTTPTCDDINSKISRFMDMLQELHPNLPLRTIPLEIRVYTPVVGRVTSAREGAMQNQNIAIAAWQRELQERFSSEDRKKQVSDVSLQRPA